MEYDTKADVHYDASGIGRIHKKGAPSAICLSTPFSKAPNYTLDRTNPSQFSICGGIKTENGFVYAYDEKTQYKLIEKKITDRHVQTKFECIAQQGITFYEVCTVSDTGVEICVEGKGSLEIVFPIFLFDGKNETKISISEHSAEVEYKGYKCCYRTEGVVKEKNEIYANRNGHYKAAAACGENKISLTIEINGIEKVS